MPGISVVIITLNEAKNLERCIRSVEGLADEILVGDSGSTDGTIKLAESLGAKVIQVEWKGYAATKNYLNSLATQPYILSLDADEVVDEKLRAEIIQQKDRLSGGYLLRRRAYVGNRAIRFGGWYPDVKLRLFPKGKAEWKGDYVHETLELEKSMALTTLSGTLHHYSFSSIEDMRSRSDKYSTLAAERLAAIGKNGLWWRQYVSAFWRFVSSYILKGGFLDGVYGYRVAATMAREAKMKYAKARHL